jgi:phage/plasmid-like protein (TIGR03299 family)
MAHALDFSNGRANFAYVGKPAWHGLGHELESGATLETWREIAGLDWEALELPTFYNFGGELREHEGRKALVRSDTGAALANVSTDYKVLQPAEVLEFYRDLCEASGLFTLETAGSLHGGKKVWAMAKSKLDLKIGASDIVLPYLFLATSYDGSMATTGKFTTVRVVCQNTLAMADSGHGAAVRIPHSTEFDAGKVKAELGLVEERAASFEKAATDMSKVKLGRKDAAEFFAELFGRELPSAQWPAAAVTDEELEALSPQRKRRLELAMAAYDDGPGADDKAARGTLWGAVNAVTFLTDHEGTGRTAESRFASANFGGLGQQTKAAAWSLAGELIGAAPAPELVDA